MNIQIVLALLLILVMLLLLSQRQIKLGRSVIRLRPLRGYRKVRGQVGRAVESGQKLHVSLGQASLVGPVATTSIAATHFLQTLAKESCANNTPPIVTVGNGTILPLAESQIREAYIAADRLYQYQPEHAQFIAEGEDNFAYAAGVTSELLQNDVLSHILAGRYGPEIGIIGGVANRQEVEQIIATDDPTALAISTAISDNVIVGEELFAAGAYLEQEPSQLAALQVQDILRWIIALLLIGLALYNFII